MGRTAHPRGACGLRSLGTKDYRAALDFLALLGDARDLDDFAMRLVDGIHRVVDCRGASYNEINVKRRRVRWVTDVETGPSHVEAFEFHLRDNPIVGFMNTNPETDAITISDLVSERSWKDYGVYRDVYHPLGLERIMAVTPSMTPQMIGVALFRDGGDFSDRDRTMLTMLRPHLAATYRSAAALSDLAGRLALLEQGLAAEGLGAVFLDAAGRVAAMSDHARTLLAAYFGESRDALPEAVRLWLDRAGLPASAAQTMPDPAALVVRRGGAAVVLRLVFRGANRLITLRERKILPAPEDLRALGLSRRESEMLALVAAGHTDSGIARLLSISPRTVSHTLARLYRKLGVENRAGAVARAMEGRIG